MPKRVLDFDALWGSDKVAACAAWAQAEYAWLYGLADASGCFELTNLRVIWGRVAAIRRELTIERLEQVFAEFQEKGLLFVWEHEGKRYAHWTGSDVPGRLPPPSWRMRLERFAPPVPKQKLAEYMSKFARGRAALAGVGFRGEGPPQTANPRRDYKSEISDLKEERGLDGQAQTAQLTDSRLLVTNCEEGGGFQNSVSKGVRETEGRGANSQFGKGQSSAPGDGRDGMDHGRRDTAVTSGLKVRVEEGQAQDLDLGLGLGLGLELNENWEMDRERKPNGCGAAQGCWRGAIREKEFIRTNSDKSSANSNANPDSNSRPPGGMDSQCRISGRVESELLEKSSSVGASRVGSAATAVRDTSVAPDFRPPEVRSGREMARGAGSYAWREKELAVERELLVGRGPICGPGRVKPEVLERIRRREAARAGS